jgi:hypothetical protein
VKEKMKFNIGTTNQEGFVSSFVIVFENGLVLKSNSILWETQQESDALQKKFDEVVEELKANGFEFSEEIGKDLNES